MYLRDWHSIFVEWLRKITKNRSDYHEPQLFRSYYQHFLVYVYTTGCRSKVLYLFFPFSTPVPRHEGVLGSGGIAPLIL
jgi:hypothetical protein